MANRAAFTETLLRRCRDLGPVRMVVRNSCGLAEAFVDLNELQLVDGWANVVVPGAHVHLTPRAFGAVAFRNVEGAGGRSAPAIWLYANGGCPTVMLVLDQTSGEAADEQAVVYGQLGRDFGPFMYLVSETHPSAPARSESADARPAFQH